MANIYELVVWEALAVPSPSVPSLSVSFAHGHGLLDRLEEGLNFRGGLPVVQALEEVAIGAIAIAIQLSHMKGLGGFRCSC